MPEVRIKDLIKVYKTGKLEVIALRGLNATIDDAGVTVIEGPSGSGKTTLLNIIGGIDLPTAGSVFVDKKKITDMKMKDLVKYRREEVGFIFQFFNLIPTMTALENVEFPMILKGMASKEMRERSKELLSLVNLSEREKHRPAELSGGEQQRVAISTALANDPPLILADEPTGELDTESGKIVLDLLRRLKEEFGKTVIIVTHDPRAMEFADRTLIIEDGMVVETR